MNSYLFEYQSNFMRKMSAKHHAENIQNILYSYSMAVRDIVKTTTRSAVDSPVYYYPRPEAEGNSTSS